MTKIVLSIGAMASYPCDHRGTVATAEEIPYGPSPSRFADRFMILQPIISVADLTKTYASGFQALKEINLDIRRGEIFALLGPNGAGKTTLINIVCGIVNPTQGVVLADGHDIITDYRAARSMIGLVPQELAFDMFDKVISSVRYSRGMFGCPPDGARIAVTAVRVARRVFVLLAGIIVAALSRSERMSV